MLWLIDPDLLWRWKRLGRSANEALWMSLVGCIQDGPPSLDGSGGETVMNHGRGEQAESGMAVLFVVPGEKLLGKGARVLQ